MARTPASVGWSRDINDLRAALRGISKDMATEILEQGVSAACDTILDAARIYAERSEDTGALKASLTKKTKAYKHSGKAVGLVGPDRRYYYRGKTVGKLGALLGGRELRRPANYAHLVEFGHRIALGGKLTRLDGRGRKGPGTLGGFVPPKPFLRPAVETTRAEQEERFYAAIARGLDRSLRRHNKRAGATVRYKQAA